MRVLIVGVGKLGYTLAEHMILEDIDVTLVDKNPKVLESIKEHMDVLTIDANGIDIGVLEGVNIKAYDLLIASTNSDETNTVICMLAKKIGCRKTVARIRSPEYTKQLGLMKSEMGIDYIINPDLATAQGISKYLLKKYTFYSDDFAMGKIRVIDFNIGYHKELVGKEIQNIKGFDELLIAAISRNGKTIIPNGTTILIDNDIIHIIGKNKDIDDLGQKFNFTNFNTDIKNVMILGGSNIAYYLAKELEKEKIQVRIIEQDKNRAEELSNKLDNTLIIYGDGTDINLLEEERLDSMDAFVGTTGFDEENLLMSLVAKQSGVGKSVAKISRPNYINIIDRLGVDAAINPVYITTSNILKYIRGGKVVSVSLLLGGDAEVTEIIVSKDSPFINIPLTELDLPEGVIIGAILRNREVIIPKGDIEIKAHDKIVVFSLTEGLPTLKMFFAPNTGGILNELWNRVKGTRNTIDN